MDFSEVGFMDSSGIGLVMEDTLKLMQEIGGNLVVEIPAHKKGYETFGNRPFSVHMQCIRRLKK